jgi:hypothetical protein
VSVEFYGFDQARTRSRKNQSSAVAVAVGAAVALPCSLLIGGAHDRNRTCDLFLTKEVLYRLSYVSMYRCHAAGSMERETGIEPAPSAWKAEVLPLNYSRAGDVLWRSGTRSVAIKTLVEGGGFEPPKA